MKNYKKYFIVPAEPPEVFTALTNPFTIELWSGYPAVMDSKINTVFSLWEGDITGKNLEIIENKKIVQEWFFGEQTEKSIVTIKLFENKKGTQVELIHTNIPDDDYENITEGWNKFYFGAIKSFFEIE
ncbi:SRPBCC domain-containing protein [Bacteroidota bacterium]